MTLVRRRTALLQSLCPEMIRFACNHAARYPMIRLEVGNPRREGFPDFS